MQSFRENPAKKVALSLEDTEFIFRPNFQKSFPNWIEYIKYEENKYETENACLEDKDYADLEAIPEF